MKRFIFIFILAEVLLFNKLAFSQYKIEKSVFGIGSTKISTTDNNISATVGQSFIGRIENSIGILNSGFWFSIIPPLNLSENNLNLQTLVSTSISDEITLTNSALTNLVIYRIKIAGTDSTLFNIQTQIIPDTLNVGESKILRVTFSPSSSGEKNAFLLVSSNSISSPDTVQLQGRGISNITVQSPERANFGESTELSINPPQNFSFTANQFFYRKGGQTNYYSVPMNLIDDNYTVIIPADSITERGIQYYVVFSDGFNFITFPEDSAQLHPASIPTYISEIIFGRNVTSVQAFRYQLVSFPLSISDQRITSVLEDDYGDYNSFFWRIFRWNPAENNYEEYNDINSGIQTGNAFWLITKEGKQFDINDANSVNLDSVFSIALQPGYNQIGNPFAFPVSWDSVKNSNLVRKPVGFNVENQDWTYNQNMLTPWTGYFVYNDSSYAINIGIPPREFPPGLLEKQTTDSEIEYNYLVQIKSNIEQSKIYENQNFVGMYAEASNDYDKFDIIKPPSISKEINLSIIQNKREYAWNIVPPSSEGRYWNLKLKNNTDKKISIKFDEIKSFTDEFKIWLLDMNRKSSIPIIRNQAGITTDGMKEMDLKLIIGTEDFAKRTAEDISLTPTEYTLFQNFPNPFNPETNIYYTLKENSNVTLEIFDILGKKVKTILQNEFQEAGIQNVNWDGTNNFGSHTASGIYIYRIRANNFIDSKKMVLVR